MRLALLTMAVSLFASVVTAQTRPIFPERAYTVLVLLYERHPDLARGDDQARRDLTEMIIQQINCEFPNQGWVWKSADPTRPPSKDAIAKHDGGRLWAWDWQDGTTRQPVIYPGKPADYDITGQNPIPRTCVDHLGNGEIPEPPPLPPADPSAHEEELAELRAEFRSFREEVQAQWEEQRAREAEAAHILAEHAASLEEHREATRQARNVVLRWLGNWKNYVAVIGGIIAGIVSQ